MATKDTANSKQELIKELKALREQVKAYDVAIKKHMKTSDTVKKRNRRLMKTIAAFNEAQQQIIQQERLHALGQMARSLVHDFNNALTPVLAASDMLLSYPELLENKEQATPLLQSIRTAARDGRTMVRRLRTFYCPEEDMDMGPIDVNALIEEAALQVQPIGDEAREKELTITIKYDLEKVPTISANASHVREILSNVIVNAVEAMLTGGTITISTRRQHEQVRIQVSDTGTGMNEDTRRHCLEPFFTTKSKKGTGLGLSVAYGIIKRYEGTIDIDSELGKGTTVSICLPVDKS